MADMQDIINTIGGYFMRGDVRGAVAFMKEVPELGEMAEAYIDIFENEHYIQYDIPEKLNRILLCYQQYFRDIFYLRIGKEEAEASLFGKLTAEIKKAGEAVGAEDHTLPEGTLDLKNDPERIGAALKEIFDAEGYQFLCGMTNGFYGPYVWTKTEPMEFEVELPETVSKYRINMNRGFVMRSWMAYLTFDKKGTGGWTSPDGTINCVEQAYDLQSERFRVSLLKHEAQHAEDIKRWPEINPKELEYRAKLVEMCYSSDPGLLAKFCSEANRERTEDSHAQASAGILDEMGKLVGADVEEIRKRARELFAASSRALDEKYCGR